MQNTAASSSHRKKQNKKSQQYFFAIKRELGISLFLFSLLICLIAAVRIINTPKYVRESPKTEVKKIPKDIEQRLMSATPSASVRVPILMYHYVEYIQNKNDHLRVALNINPDVFEKQVKTLKDAQYTFLTAKDLGEILDGKRSLPEKPILLTFDDGHWDFASVVLPILKKYQVKATQYVIPGFTGGSDFMTKNQVWSIVTSGLVDVGVHTVHHISLAGQPFSVVQYEIAESKQMLEDTYHIHVVSFAYPNGSFDTQAADVVRLNGFTTGVSTIPGIMQSNSNRFFLYRLRPGQRAGEELLNWLNQNQFTAF
jgi:peptidoglycan/xylan/chitin deacetylase (PgdA/CDA1 family)